MQINKPEHVIGKFNPHLETLIKLCADEVSTPQQKCIGWPEQKYISDAGKKVPELGAFSSGIKPAWDYPPQYRSWQGVSVACFD
jgi:hypothetical protein